MSADRHPHAARSHPHAQMASPLVDHARHAAAVVRPAVFAANTSDPAPVGCFHYATLLRNRPQILATWRVSSTRPAVPNRVAELLGGTPQHLGGNTWSVTTNTTTADILLPDPGALRLRWCRDARHTCDGSVQRDQETQRPCTCPPYLPERRMATRHGHACEPQVEVIFRLSEDPALGLFCFASGSWSLAEDAIRAMETLRAYRGPARARLHLHRAPCTLAAGQVITCTTPTLIVLGPVDRRSGGRRRAAGCGRGLEQTKAMPAQTL
jgi:hypothetical protein